MIHSLKGNSYSYYAPVQIQINTAEYGYKIIKLAHEIFYKVLIAYVLNRGSYMSAHVLLNLLRVG